MRLLRTLNLFLTEHYVKAGMEIRESGRVSFISGQLCLLVSVRSVSPLTPLAPAVISFFIYTVNWICSSSLVGVANLDFDSSVPPEMRDSFSIRETDFASNSQREQFSFLTFFRSIL